MNPQVTYHTQQIPVRTNHVLHFILTLFTFGLWLPVWIIMAAINNSRVKTYTNQSVTQVWPSASDVHQYSVTPTMNQGNHRWCLTHQAWEPKPDAEVAA